MNRLIVLGTLMLSLLGFAAESQSQVLVYKVEFGGAKGINFHPFEGGYVVVPLLGGSGTFLLTSSEDGRTFSESSEGGKFFVAVSGSGDQKAVLSATTGSGTASGSLVVIGDINHIIKINSRTLSLSMRVAKSLTGTLVSADDESEAETTAIDGSLGSAGFADVKMVLDTDLTNDSNKESLTLEEAVELVKIQLEREGFSAEGGTDPDPDPDPDAQQ